MKTLRRYTPEDAELLLKWRNHPETRRWSFSADIIPLDRHLEWFIRFLADPAKIGFVMTDGNQALAQIRFEPPPSPGTLTISTSVSPDHFGKGLGKEILRMAMEHPDVLKKAALARAETFTDNLPSQKIFSAAGFVQVGLESSDCREYLEWMKPIGETLSNLQWAMAGSKLSPEIQNQLETLNLMPQVSFTGEDWPGFMAKVKEIGSRLLVLADFPTHVPSEVFQSFSGRVVFFTPKAFPEAEKVCSDSLSPMIPDIITVHSSGQLLQEIARIAWADSQNQR